jgi:hypothetical protein
LPAPAPGGRDAPGVHGVGDNPKSAKFTWFNEKDGKAARGGEVPVEALPQMLDFAIRKGFVSLTGPFAFKV